MLGQDRLFIQQLEKDYILLDINKVRREYNSLSPKEIDIIFNDEYGSTKSIDMKIDEEDFERIITEAQEKKCLFGIWRKSIR